MNKPEPPEIFARANTLFKRVADTSGRLIRNARDAGERAIKGAADESDEARKKRRVVILGGGGVLAAILVLATLSRLGGGEVGPTEIDTRQAVTAIAVSAHNFEPRISLNGEARPVRDIQVAAPASGVRILELLVDEGDTVRQGQPMARLDTALAQAQTRGAQASVAEAQSAAIRARGEYERAESIRNSGALSSEAIEQRRAAAVAADARLSAARAQLQELNARLGGGYVRAPAAGLVIDRTAEVGRSVDGQILFRIAAGNELEVAASVAESDALALQEGQDATFTLVDGSSVTARLRRPPASIDSRTRTGEALFALPEGSRVRAGMFLRGEAVLAPRAALAAPQSSILYEDGAAYVLVIDQTGHARRANVALGVRDGVMVEIVSGLEAGQRIVGSGAAFVQDGDEVRTLAPEAPDAATAASSNLRGRGG